MKPEPQNRQSLLSANDDQVALRERLAETVVLIPAAGRVAEGVLALSNIACPAMVPVAGRPVIHWTISYLRSLGLRRFVIAVSRRGMFVEDFVECSFGTDCEIQFIVPSADGGVGRTLLDLAAVARGKAALVVLGDTHFQFADPAVLAHDEAAVLVESVDDSYRWCTVDADTQGRILDFHDKEPDLPAPLAALIGVYYFPQLEQLQNAARQAVSDHEQREERTELADILRLVNRERPIYAVRAGDWLDCGNPDRQASSHRSLLQKREFNELSIDSVMGTITKRSHYVEKFLDEINYLRLLPPELAVLFPRVLNYSTDWQDPWMTLEYYGYPTLAEAFVFENVNPGVWDQVFIHLRDILVGGLMRHRRPLSSDVLREMYLTKTQSRLEQLQASPELVSLVRHEGPVVVNGVEVENLPQLWGKLQVDVARMAENVQGCVVHGDLCLSNVLYDFRSRVCKFIDPRGNFGVAGIYGDPRYDVAKLYHSVYGMYDFITNDLFHVEISGTRINLDIRSRPQHAQIQERFERVFFAEFDRREITLITGLLFASMPALHYDAPRRQMAMYARALQLFSQVYTPASVA